jgi:transposase-like protein
MSRLPKARKDAILNKMLAPHPPTIRELAQREGISEATLYNWRNQLRKQGRPVPEHDRSSENWSAQTKFAVVLETATLSEVELSEYCRAKGLFPEQVKQWREISIQAHVEGETTDSAGAKLNKQIKRFTLVIRASAQAATHAIVASRLRRLTSPIRRD